MRLVLELGKRYPEITGPASDAFSAELNTACETEGMTELVLDLDGIRAINSMAMGSIFASYQKLRDAGKTLTIVNASDKVTNLLKMVNMSDILM